MELYWPRPNFKNNEPLVALFYEMLQGLEGTLTLSPSLPLC